MSSTGGLATTSYGLPFPVRRGMGRDTVWKGAMPTRPSPGPNGRTIGLVARQDVPQDASVGPHHGPNAAVASSRGHPLENRVARQERAQGQWLTINAACKLIGVDQSTLRRWSDAGKVPVFRTPGGHRRYSEETLRRLVGDGAREVQPLPDDAPSPAERANGIDEDRLITARERRWYRALSQATLDELRRYSRQLNDLACRYVAAQSGSADRARVLGEARQIGDAYGRVSATSGLSPSESVEAFLYFRTPVIRSAIVMTDDVSMPARRAMHIQVELGQFLDDVLIAAMRSHQQIPHYRSMA